MIYSISSNFTLVKLHAEFLDEKKKGRLAFVLGNGINRYAYPKKMCQLGRTHEATLGRNWVKRRLPKYGERVDVNREI